MKRSILLVLMSTMALTACGDTTETGGGPAVEEASPEEPSPEAEGPGPECVETDELTAADNEWDPGCVVTSGSLTVTNGGEAAHTFTITGSVDVTLESGQSEEVDVTEAAEPVGETYFLCTIHSGMDGFLWVQ